VGVYFNIGGGDSGGGIYLKNMLFQLMRLYGERIIFPIRRKHLVSRIAPYLKGFNKILDLGSSDGRIASQLIKNFLLLIL